MGAPETHSAPSAAPAVEPVVEPAATPETAPDAPETVAEETPAGDDLAQAGVSDSSAGE